MDHRLGAFSSSKFCLNTLLLIVSSLFLFLNIKISILKLFSKILLKLTYFLSFSKLHKDYSIHQYKKCPAQNRSHETILAEHGKTLSKKYRLFKETKTFKKHLFSMTKNLVYRKRQTILLNPLSCIREPLIIIDICCFSYYSTITPSLKQLYIFILL